ncbi:glutathione S-transferase class-mu 26 kDa isozyme 47-like [Convolutriloba macropyga]|uniref:glutathione S-transferase class-mu 26 kDa isozyme 47-like n=1 Tax=Convolutriloba macropyga TaxID=536237 RepID=UPI003F525077
MSSEAETSSEQSDLIRIGYWDIRGLVEPIRMILHHNNVPYKFENFFMDPKMGKFHPGWQEGKLKLGLDFPNLPYYIDKDVTISQSGAILKYVGKKYGLAGQTPQEEAKIDEIADVIKLELHYFFFLTCYSGDRFETMKEFAIAQARQVFKQFDVFLGDKEWLFGSNMKYPDFHLWSMLDAYLVLEPTVLDGCDNLVKYKERFESIPSVKEYTSNDSFNKYQLCHPVAAFGGTGKPPGE